MPNFNQNTVTTAALLDKLQNIEIVLEVFGNLKRIYVIHMY